MSPIGQAYRQSANTRQAEEKAAAEKDYQEQLPTRKKLANKALKSVSTQLSAHFTQVAAAIAENKTIPTSRADFKAHIGRELRIEDIMKLSQYKKIDKLCEQEDIGVRAQYYRQSGDLRISIDLQSSYPKPSPGK